MSRFSNDRKVYLAGPIAGCDAGEANNWRHEFGKRLAEIGVVGISPLRCEPLIGERYELQYDADPRFGAPRAIAAKNFYDVRTCALTLAYMPLSLIQRRTSVGTIIEIAKAHELNKPVILVSDDPYSRNHPVLQECVGWNLETLDEAFDVIEGLMARDF